MKVEYLDHSGSDLLIVNAARCSFGKESDWHEEVLDSEEAAIEYAEKVGGTVDYDHIYSDRWFGGYPVTHLADKDKKLINFLAREKHVLPFRHPSITLRCQAPIFVARQLMKHQAGMSWSEESRRYITTAPEILVPEMRAAAENVKQGSSAELVEEWEQLMDKYVLASAAAIEMYYEMLDKGVAPEVARTILPVSTEVTWVWTGTLLAWHHMLNLRLAADTQRETQEFAKMVDDIITPLYPVSMEALKGAQQ